MIGWQVGEDEKKWEECAAGCCITKDVEVGLLVEARSKIFIHYNNGAKGVALPRKLERVDKLA